MNQYYTTMITKKFQVNRHVEPWPGSWMRKLPIVNPGRWLDYLSLSEKIKVMKKIDFKENTFSCIQIIYGLLQYFSGVTYMSHQAIFLFGKCLNNYANLCKFHGYFNSTVSHI